MSLTSDKAVINNATHKLQEKTEMRGKTWAGEVYVIKAKQ